MDINQIKENLIMHIRKVIFFTAALWISTLSFAWGEESWQMDLYLNTGAAGVDGEFGVGDLSVDLDTGLKDFGGTLGFSAMKNQWGFYVEGFGLIVKKEMPSSTEVAEATVRQSITEAGAVYRLTQVLDLLAGVRHQGIGLKFRVSDGTTPDDSTGVFDVFAGAKIGRFAPTDRWLCWAEGDIGAGDSDLVWNLRLATGYRLTEKWYIYTSCRYIHTDFEGSGIRYDCAMKAVGLGLGYSF
jgi:hypothetical protein